jgi:hypothetical protein
MNRCRLPEECEPIPLCLKHQQIKQRHTRPRAVVGGTLVAWMILPAGIVLVGLGLGLLIGGW